ncbi:phage tail protein [Lonepinella sp. MS14436]|uniref:phage tail protein n=1 Tax=Lonepinella sp. MS14436 TaxID=3003619 RepID=UPI0036DB9241
MSLNEDVMRINARLRNLGNNTMPKATAKAINKVASKISSTAMKAVAKDVGVPLKTIKGRLKKINATAKKPKASLKILRSQMPAIRLLEKKSNRIWVGRGGIVIGKYAIQRGFKQRLKNGRIHILQRKGRARYPIDVVKIPIGNQITQQFNKATHNYPKEVKEALLKELMTTLR